VLVIEMPGGFCLQQEIFGYKFGHFSSPQSNFNQTG
jgi:hypothetical protein